MIHAKGGTFAINLSLTVVRVWLVHSSLTLERMYFKLAAKFTHFHISEMTVIDEGLSLADNGLLFPDYLQALALARIVVISKHEPSPDSYRFFTQYVRQRHFDYHKVLILDLEQPHNQLYFADLFSPSITRVEDEMGKGCAWRCRVGWRVWVPRLEDSKRSGWRVLTLSSGRP